MTTAIHVPRRPKIEYPDSDGKPMSEHDLQYKWIVVIKEGLVVQFRRDPDVYVAADLLWYPVEGKPAIRGAPDTFVVFGRPKRLRGSYKQWEEGGIAPQVVFEILPPGNRPAEMQRKFVFYEQYGVEEYYIYDPFDGSLQGWRRRGRKLKKIGRMRGFVSPRLGIRFEPGKGSDNLTIIGRNGERFLTFEEVTQRAETAEQRAQRYAAMLREMGIEPD
jgi:Uma2 family endonuclease